jgi:hypothetical protein
MNDIVHVRDFYKVFVPWNQSEWVVSGWYTGHVYGRYATKDEAVAAAEAMPIPRPGELGWLA